MDIKIDASGVPFAEKNIIDEHGELRTVKNPLYCFTPDEVEQMQFALWFLATSESDDITVEYEERTDSDEFEKRVREIHPRKLSDMLNDRVTEMNSKMLEYYADDIEQATKKE